MWMLCRLLPFAKGLQLGQLEHCVEHQDLMVPAIIAKLMDADHIAKRM